ncbi:MAG TPA: hypothetical protein VF801_00165 [Rhodocyclaceae bacterium]
MRLDGYVGRMVRLKHENFQPIVRRARRRGHDDLENRFIVASVDGEMGKLICYGADVRVAVAAGEVALL